MPTEASTQRLQADDDLAPAQQPAQETSTARRERSWSKLARPAAVTIVAISVAAIVLDMIVVLTFPAAVPSIDATRFSSLAPTIAGIPLAVVVMVLTLRRPENPAGWLLGSFVVLVLVGGLCSDYLYHWLYGHDLPVGPVTPLALIAASGGPASFFGITALLLVFPDGHVLSRRWRGVVWLNLVLAALSWHSSALRSPRDRRRSPPVAQPDRHRRCAPARERGEQRRGPRIVRCGRHRPGRAGNPLPTVGSGRATADQVVRCWRGGPRSRNLDRGYRLAESADLDDARSRHRRGHRLHRPARVHRGGRSQIPPVRHRLHHQPGAHLRNARRADHGGVRGHRRGDWDPRGERRKAEPRAVDPRHSNRGRGLPAGTRAHSEGGQPAGVRTAGDTIRGAERVLRTRCGDLCRGRGVAPDGAGAPGGDGSGVGDGVVACERRATRGGDIPGRTGWASIPADEQRDAPGVAGGDPHSRGASTRASCSGP